MSAFGKTWWGEQWLNSLSHIDYSNRLPRGRSYARNDFVQKITVTNNTVKAKVRGSRSTPYSITITVPLFDAKQNKLLIKTILSNPLLLSRLLNRELPEELNTIAQKNKVPVFPTSWKDLDMYCSCPDWAVPCKHLAAVIYILSAEIDKNPFTIFSLHGLDILKELEKSGFSGREELQAPRAADLFFDKPQKTATVKKVDKTLDTIDLSSIKPMREILFSLLDKPSLFYKKDFLVHLRKNYKAVERNLKFILSNEKQKEHTTFDLERIEDVEVIMHNEVFYYDTIFYSGNEEKHFSKQKGFEQLVKFISAIPGKYADRLPIALKALYEIYHLSLKLIETGGFIPQLLKLSNGNYSIRWIPAVMNEKIENIIGKIEKITPSKIIQMLGDAAEPKYMSNHDQVICLTSLFIGHFFYAYATIPTKSYSRNGDYKIDSLFFTNSSEKFHALAEAEIPNSIYQWISPFYITQKQYTPIIKIEEIDDDDVTAFGVELWIENRKQSMQTPVTFSDFLNQAKYAVAKAGVLQSLSNLADDYKDMERYIASGGEEELLYNSEEFAEILLQILPVIKLLGIKILLPKALQVLVKPKTSLLLQKKADAGAAKSFLNLEEMLNFEWQVALGDQTLSVNKFKELVKGMSGVVKIKEQYVLIDQDEIQKLLDNLSKEEQLSKNELLKVALTEEYQEAKISISSQARKTIQALFKSPKKKIPGKLDAQLRPYQERGYQWLYNNVKVGFGSVLADDMGLGKTIQVISLLLQLKTDKKLAKTKVLIVVPTTLISNWQKEIQRFAPSLSTHTYHGSKREFKLADCDLMITSYGILRSDISQFQKRKWAAVIIDEAQNIKNPTTEQTKSVKKLKAPIKIAMSGTPVENRLTEYWSIFDFVNKSYLGSLSYFKQAFSKPIELYNDQKQLEKFKAITSPFILRRLKTDKNIISDLPEKVENNRYVSLTKEQTALYQNIVNDLMSGIDEVDGNKIKRAGLIFKLMTALKQICNHPSQFLKKSEYSHELSGKALMLLNILQNIYENDEKVLIFTQYKEMGDILKIIIEKHFNNQALFLHGGITRKKRETLIEDFQNEKRLKTFILSIKAGGTGLNLTEANHVIHYDLWWNPAVEAQATDRAFRIGQQKNVMVYRMICKGTFEEKIDEMIQHKKKLANLTVATGEKWIGDLSNKELSELVKL